MKEARFERYGRMYRMSREIPDELLCTFSSMDKADELFVFCLSPTEHTFFVKTNVRISVMRIIFLTLYLK
jgi:hypothetical protein